MSDKHTGWYIPSPIEPRLPQLPIFRSLFSSEIAAMSDDDLVKVLHGEDNETVPALDISSRQAITTALLTRAIQRSSVPHWSVVPSFWLLVASLTIAITALCVAWMALPAPVVVPPHTQSD